MNDRNRIILFNKMIKGKLLVKMYQLIEILAELKQINLHICEVYREPFLNVN